MLRNFFKIAYRNLVKNRIYTVINIVGFAIGLASCIIILLFVNYEMSYDSFYANADDIYRVASHGSVSGNEYHLATTAAPMAGALMEDYPEVVSATRIMADANMLIRNGDIIFIESNFFWADSLFFEVFQCKMILGDPTKVLNADHTVVLTRKLAMKYFGRLDIVGEVLEFEDYTPYTITGVCEDTPENGHFKFDMLASMNSLGLAKSDFWLNYELYTYVQLRSGTDPNELESKFSSMIKKYIEPQLLPYIGGDIKKYFESGGFVGFELQPIRDIHLKSHLKSELNPNGDITYIYIFSIIAVFILIIASINFMNLSTARATTRAREVGVRKVLGSNMAQLLRQFLTESIILTTIAMAFAILLVYLALPFFNDIAERNFHFDLFASVYTIPLILLTIIIVGTLAGIYPAFYLSSFQPVKVLKTTLTSSGRSSYLRSGLVIFQFSISIFLFIATFVIQDQLYYVQNQNLGWNKDSMIIIKRAWAVENNEDVFLSELKQNPDILNVCSSGHIPGRDFNTVVFRKDNVPRSEQKLANKISVKYDFDKTFKLDLLAGRFFSREYSSDLKAAVVNESLVKTMGIENPVGSILIRPGDTEEHDRRFRIVGVVKDFHYESFRQKVKPLVMLLNNRWPIYIAVRANSNKIKETVSFLKETWKKFIPDKPFEYFFMDEDFAELYDKDIQTAELFTAFSILAIAIACLGLFGLATFSTMSRRKEIGIRKTLGASIPSIIIKFSMQLSKWVLFANLIAWPAAYLFIDKWLNNFEYKVDIEFVLFIIAGILAFVIAIITVIYQSFKAALANPVSSLRYE